MNNNPLVSILVPVYNVEKYIERCARSVFEQTYENLEFIFVDDCTPDNSIAILKKIISDYPNREPCIRIFKHEHNRGLTAVRNTLVAAAKGEFIVHVDSDDWMERNDVELLMKRQQETNADIVTGAAYSHYEDRIEEYPNGGWNKDKQQLLEGLLGHYISTTLWRRLIRISLYRRNDIKAIEGLCSGEDFQVLPRLVYYSSKVSGISNLIYHYNQTNENSCVTRLKSNVKIQLDSYYSRRSIVSFFSDKEQWLKGLSCQMLVFFVHNIMRQNAINGYKEGYKVFLQLLYSTDSNYWYRVSWDNCLKRWIDSNYYTMKMYHFMRSLVHGIL